MIVARHDARQRPVPPPAAYREQQSALDFDCRLLPGDDASATLLHFDCALRRSAARPTAGRRHEAGMPEHTGALGAAMFARSANAACHGRAIRYGIDAAMTSIAIAGAHHFTPRLRYTIHFKCRQPLRIGDADFYDISFLLSIRRHDFSMKIARRLLYHFLFMSYADTFPPPDSQPAHFSLQPLHVSSSRRRP